jgi:hypothetical protein
VTRAGWSFGFCLGACRGDLTIDGRELDYRLSDRSGEQTLARAAGALTSAGRSRLNELAAALGSVPLEEVYGCPDCADGGAAWLELQRETVTASTRYEYRRPPPPLESLDAFLREVMGALETCVATGAVALSPACEPLRR